MFGCLGIRFTENQFPCLVRSNILRKMEFVLRKLNSHVWFVQTFYGKYEMPSNLCGKNACKTVHSLPLQLQTYIDTQLSIVHPLQKFCYKLVVEEFVAKFASKYTAHCPTTHLRPHQHLSTWAL